MHAGWHGSAQPRHRFGPRYGIFLFHCDSSCGEWHSSWFFLDKSTVGYRVLWPFTLIVMGITALSGAHIVAALQFSRLIAVYFDRVALAIFVAYIVIVLFIRRDFLIPFLTIHSRNRCDQFRWRYISVQMICCSGILAAPPAASHHAFWRSEHGTQWSSVCAAPS